MRTPSKTVLVVEDNDGFSMNGQVSTEMKEDIKGFIQNPFNRSELLTTVRRTFNSDKPVVSLI